MGLLSLIVPASAPTPLPAGRIDRYRKALEARGHRVEVLVVSDASAPEDCPVRDAIQLRIDEEGLGRCVLAGLNAASGDLILLLDTGFDYSADDLCAVAGQLDEGQGDLVLASRFAPGAAGRGPRRLYGAMARLLLGTSDPMSGLVGLTRDQLDEILETLRPSGNRFAWEILARSRSASRRRAEHPAAAARLTPMRLGFDEIRNLKHLADHRFGNFSRLIQFCVVGASGMVVDLTCYALFQALLRGGQLARHQVPVLGSSLDLAVAGGLSIAVALTWNFLLNRRLTFSYARNRSILRQYLTYALSNSLGIVLSWTLRLILPARISFFAEHKLAAAVVGIVAATGISFTMARWLVFSQSAPESGTPQGAPPLAESHAGL